MLLTDSLTSAILDKRTFRFFRPYVPENYRKGINGKKVVVFGASFDCRKYDCPFFDECTSCISKDSSKFDQACPEYRTSGVLLSEEPSNCVGERYRAYKKFADFMSPYVGAGEDPWDYMGFTNYVQYFVSTVAVKHKYIDKERDFEAFKETLYELMPDVVFVWGVVTVQDILCREEVVDYEQLSENEWYVFHLRLYGMDKLITVINSYHPSSYGKRGWNRNMDVLRKYTDIVLERNPDASGEPTVVAEQNGCQGG